jgi:hypothetical protein
MSNMLLAALDYARQGLPVLPLWGLLEARSADGRLLCRCGKLDCKRCRRLPMNRPSSISGPARRKQTSASLLARTPSVSMSIRARVARKNSRN